MPKYPTFPECFDLVDQVSISSLRKWGYLEPGRRTPGTIVWTRDGRTVGSISVIVDMVGEFVELEYSRAGEHIKDRVRLANAPSNLSKGRVWYFICPATGMRCRKLYQIGDKLSRYAFPSRGLRYRSPPIGAP